MGGKAYISFDLAGTFRILSTTLPFQYCYSYRRGRSKNTEKDRFPQSDKNNMERLLFITNTPPKS